MPLILAIEPDKRQAARITSLARERLRVELLVVDSAERALHTLSDRVPDLILTSLLLSGKDEAALDERLRQLDAAGSHVQTLMIPMLAGSGRRTTRKDGLLNRLRRAKDEPATEGGCDPAVFAAQIAEYLEKAADERADRAAHAEQKRVDRESAPPAVEEPAVSGDAFVTAPSSVNEPYEFAFPQAPISEVASEFAAPPAPVAPEMAAVAAAATQPDVVFEPYVPAPFVEPEPRIDDAPAPSFAAPQRDDTAPAFEPIVPAAFQRVAPQRPAAARFDEVAAPADEILAPVEASAAFDEFVVLEELSLMDAPSVALGELAEAMERYETEGSWDEHSHHATGDAGSVLDALEVLDEPEIPDVEDFQPARWEPKRRLVPVAPEPIDDVEPDHTASDFDFEGDLWMPLPVAAQRRWPTLEGPTVKATPAPGFDAPPDPGVEFAPPPASDRPSGKKRKPNKPAQDEWGFFDPVQCGFAALLAKLDEVTDKE